MSSTSRRSLLRRTCAGTVALAATLTVGACSSGSDTGAASTGPVEITYWSWMPGTQETAEAFNKAQSKVHVTYQKSPSSTEILTQLSNAVKAGNGPDVVNVEYNALPEVVSQGQLKDLGSAKDTVGLFPQSVRELVTLGDKTWAVPFDASPQELWYRKDLFAQYGVTAPKTWDDFRAAAAKVKQAAPDTRITTLWTDDPAPLTGMAWQAGAKWFAVQGQAWKPAVDDAATLKVASYWDDLVKGDLVWTQKAYSPEWTKGLVDGKTLSYIGGPWSGGGIKTMAPDQAGKWGVLPLPTWDGTPATGLMGGSVFAVSKDSKDKRKNEAALAFITFATTTPEGIKARLGSGKSTALPAFTDVRSVAATTFDPAYFGSENPYTVAGNQVDTIRPGWVYGPVQLAVNAELKNGLAKVASGGSLTDAVKAAQQKAVAEIKNRGLNLAP
ncbi:ABC transporter substrate-binding protein [Kitasatospora purpeofusca]|uniref:ABC transporter substrate-binding protein n=1 Tax=Kitasatospora purpeofusca TaxID=67352 RepID=UPI003646998C